MVSFFVQFLNHVNTLFRIIYERQFKSSSLVGNQHVQERKLVENIYVFCTISRSLIIQDCGNCDLNIINKTVLMQSSSLNFLSRKRKMYLHVSRISG